VGFVVWLWNWLSVDESGNPVSTNRRTRSQIQI
jgi:hypothetical protein